MAVAETDFAKVYLRFLRSLEVIARYLPRSLQWPVASLINRFGSPYNRSAADISAAIGDALALDTSSAHRAWLRWRASHARCMLTIFQYDRMDTQWLQRTVAVEQPQLLQRMVQTGGLILTYHTHHQNTLAALLGVAGCTISPVAASAADSPLYQVIGRYIDLINNGSQRQFRGGTYLYTDNLRRVLREARTRLQRGELLLSLCDFHQQSSEPPHTLFGRTITPPTGVIRLALQCGVPIYLGLLFPMAGGRFRLALAEARGSDLHTVIDEYLAFLEQTVRHAPEAWQGWTWYNLLPTAGPVREDASV